MKRTMLVVLLAVVMGMFQGCSSTESQRLRNAGDTYAATVGLLADARQAGLIDDDEALRIEVYRSVARAALDAWHEAYDDPDVAGSAFENAAIAALDALLDIAVTSKAE